MTDFEYTHFWEEYSDFNSDAIDNVWYNANERYAVLDWNDELYQYNDVDLERVERIVSAKSVGAEAAAFKRERGEAGKPAVHLGRFYDIAWDRVAEVVTISPNVEAVTPTFSGDATAEFSLQDVPVASSEPGLSVASENYTYELFFDLDGTERSHTIKDAKTLESALNGLNDAAEALGVPIVVKKAVVTFV